MYSECANLRQAGYHLEFQSHDHSIHHMPLPVGGPLELSLSLTVFEIFRPNMLTN